MEHRPRCMQGKTEVSAGIWVQGGLGHMGG